MTAQALTPQALTQATFDAAVLTSDVPVLVDFWGENCAQCRLLTRVLDDLCADVVGRMSIGTVNVTEHEALARRFDVTSVPTLMVFKAGKPVARMTGARPRSRLLDELQPYL